MRSVSKDWDKKISCWQCSIGWILTKSKLPNLLKWSALYGINTNLFLSLIYYLSLNSITPWFPRGQGTETETIDTAKFLWIFNWEKTLLKIKSRRFSLIHFCWILHRFLVEIFLSMSKFTPWCAPFARIGTKGFHVGNVQFVEYLQKVSFLTF